MCVIETFTGPLIFTYENGIGGDPKHNRYYHLGEIDTICIMQIL